MLKKLPSQGIGLPISEIRQYLQAQYSLKGELHPRVFEETVGAVLGSLGYKVEVTSYSNDGGLDVILEDGAEHIGVQVKRSKNRIEAESIRALAGALVINKMTKGVFVTTSSFRSGAHKATDDLSEIGMDVSLVDGSTFLEVLQLTQRPAYRSFEEFSQEHDWKSYTCIYGGGQHGV